MTIEKTTAPMEKQACRKPLADRVNIESYKKLKAKPDERPRPDRPAAARK